MDTALHKVNAQTNQIMKTEELERAAEWISDDNNVDRLPESVGELTAILAEYASSQQPDWDKLREELCDAFREWDIEESLPHPHLPSALKAWRGCYEWIESKLTKQ